MRSFIVIAGFACASLASPAVAQTAGDRQVRQVEALQNCRAISDAAARVTCYDAATDALLVASRSSELVILDRGEIKKARRGLFGFALPRISFLDRTTSIQEADESRRLETKLLSVTSLGYGKYRLRLPDGAAWETVESSSRLSLRGGDTVVIEKGLLGAYFLVAGGARVQARRLPQR